MNKINISFVFLAFLGCDSNQSSVIQGNWRQVDFERFNKRQPNYYGEYLMFVNGRDFASLSAHDSYSIVEYFENESPIRYKKSVVLPDGTVSSFQGIVSLSESEMIECYSLKDDSLPKRFDTEPGRMVIMDVWQRHPVRIDGQSGFQGDWVLREHRLEGNVESDEAIKGSRMKILGNFCHSHIVKSISGQLNFVERNKAIIVDKITNKRTYLIFGIINGRLEVCCDDVREAFPKGFFTDPNNNYYLRRLEEIR